MYREDITNNLNNSKGLFFIFFFRFSNFFCRNYFLKIIGFPVRGLYKVIIQWIFGIDIPDGTHIGSGLKIYHGIGLVVNKDVIIGSNVILRHCTTIGNSKKNGKCPVIEDNVIVGANCVIIGDIIVGRNAVVAAGSVVNKNVPSYSLVAGNPAIVKKKYEY